MMLEPPLMPPAPPLEREQGAFVFFSYAHRDKGFRDRLEDHLSNLKYRGLITAWHDREIQAGEEWAQQIGIYLNEAHIILLLISSDFMASEYCYSIEMKRALERHEQREADVIPILLRPVLYTDAPFAKLQMLPANGKPVARWRDRDSAFVDIANGIERVAQKYSPQRRVVRYRPSSEDSLMHQPSGGCVLLPLIGAGVIIVGLITAGVLALSQHPSLIPIVIYVFGGLVLVGGAIAAIGAIRALHAGTEQRQAQEAREVARKQRYYEEAIEAYQRALSRSPSDGDALRGMGNALYALERHDKALDAFLRAIQCNPTPAAYAGLGNVLAKLQRYSEAVAAYDKAIKLDPAVTFNYDNLIQSLTALGRKEEAEQAHTRAKQLGYEDEE
ncbi:MAG: hypothetical protein NVS4B7_16320 [Ktedonobacteraceae bacterium]